jgi:hypothetical protein
MNEKVAVDTTFNLLNVRLVKREDMPPENADPATTAPAVEVNATPVKEISSVPGASKPKAPEAAKALDAVKKGDK